MRKNQVEALGDTGMLEKVIAKCQNRAVDTAQVIQELIALAKDMREAGQRGEQL